MAKVPNPYLTDDENPEWTEEDFAKARSASEILPPVLYAELTKRKPGQRGPGKRPNKVAVTLRLDPDVLAAFKADGAGWQTRINDALRQTLERNRAQN